MLDERSRQSGNQMGEVTNDDCCPFDKINYSNVDSHPEKCATQLYNHVVNVIWNHSSLTEEAKYELARLLSILQNIKGKKMASFLPELQVAISALICNEPKVQLAKTIRYRLDMESLEGPFVDILMKSSKGNPVAIIGLGTLITALFGIFPYFLIRTLMDESGVSSLLLINDKLILVVAEADFLGGVVSILTRLKDFSLLRDFDPIFLFWTGFLKPYVGVILAMFVFSFLKSGFITVGPTYNTANYMWWAVGFLSGFSERFTWDVISRSEGVLSTPNKNS